MELGNIIFGNSRGQKSIPRNKSFEGPWQELCDELKISWYGYQDEGCKLPTNGRWTETDVFKVQSYDWDADCDCGADDKMERWFDANKHSDACYQSECDRELKAYDDSVGFKKIETAAFDGDKSFFRGFNEDTKNPAPGVTMTTFEPRSDPAMDVWRTASDARDKFRDAMRKRLCKERKLPYPSGCADHCDCGRDERSDIFWREIGGHKEDCRNIQPNFLYKPTGFRINWYKYPFRDSYMTPGISTAQWRKIVRHCIESAKASHIDAVSQGE
jgi:hypothetical protein